MSRTKVAIALEKLTTWIALLHHRETRLLLTQQQTASVSSTRMMRLCMSITIMAESTNKLSCGAQQGLVSCILLTCNDACVHDVHRLQDRNQRTRKREVDTIVQMLQHVL